MQTSSSMSGISSSGGGKSNLDAGSLYPFGRPLISNVGFPNNDVMVISFRDGRSVYVPLSLFPNLRDANRELLENWRIIGEGIGIHWPDLDEDLPAEAFLGGGLLVRNNPGTLQRYHRLEMQ